MSVWFTADLHLSHRNIIDHCNRPRTSVEEMDAALIERWNDVVGPGDTVWVLGDIALGDRHLDPVQKLNGRKILVAGNHDTCWTGHRKQTKARKAIPLYLAAGFDQVHDSGVVYGHRIAGIDVVLSHLPYAGDHTTEDRYADRRPPDDGLPMLCGHVHNAWQVNGRMINVGVDVWNYAPVLEETIADLLQTLRNPRRRAHD